MTMKAFEVSAVRGKAVGAGTRALKE